MTTLYNKEVWKELEPVDKWDAFDARLSEKLDSERTFCVQRSGRASFEVEVQATSESEAINKARALPSEDWEDETEERWSYEAYSI
jgi:hypothetical protein